MVRLCGVIACFVLTACQAGGGCHSSSAPDTASLASGVVVGSDGGVVAPWSDSDIAREEERRLARLDGMFSSEELDGDLHTHRETSIRAAFEKARATLPPAQLSALVCRKRSCRAELDYASLATERATIARLTEPDAPLGGFARIDYIAAARGRMRSTVFLWEAAP
jgi:hypothetical protein